MSEWVSVCFLFWLFMFFLLLLLWLPLTFTKQHHPFICLMCAQNSRRGKKHTHRTTAIQYTLDSHDPNFFYWTLCHTTLEARPIPGSRSPWFAEYFWNFCISSFNWMLICPSIKLELRRKTTRRRNLFSLAQNTKKRGTALKSIDSIFNWIVDVAIDDDVAFIRAVVVA